MATAKEDFDWQPLIGRFLGYMCLVEAEMLTKTTLEQARFLMRYGLPRKEAAMIVGSSDDSLRVMIAQADKKPAAAKAKR